MVIKTRKINFNLQGVRVYMKNQIRNILIPITLSFFLASCKNILTDREQSFITDLPCTTPLMQSYSSPGSYSFVVPSTSTCFRIEMSGGGGGGGSVDTGTPPAIIARGGSAELVEGTFNKPGSDLTLNIVVGAGGLRGDQGSNGTGGLGGSGDGQGGAGGNGDGPLVGVGGGGGGASSISFDTTTVWAAGGGGAGGIGGMISGPSCILLGPSNVIGTGGGAGAGSDGSDGADVAGTVQAGAIGMNGGGNGGGGSTSCAGEAEDGGSGGNGLGSQGGSNSNGTNGYVIIYY